MGKIRAKIIVKGRVQKVGFRSFVKELAEMLDLKGIVENLPDGNVKVLCEGDKGDIKDLIKEIKQNPPSLSSIEEVKVEYSEYKGEFKTFERVGEDIIKEKVSMRDTMKDMLKVMKSFDEKSEKAIKILGEIKTDAKEIPAIKENTEKIMVHTKDIPAIKENTTEIKDKLTSLLWEKYEKLEEEISEIKITLSKIQEKVL